MITDFDRRDRITAVASLIALLVAVVSVSLLVHVWRTPLLDTPDARPAVATFAPIPAPSARLIPPGWPVDPTTVPLHGHTARVEVAR